MYSLEFDIKTYIRQKLVGIYERFWDQNFFDGATVLYLRPLHSRKFELN